MPLNLPVSRFSAHVRLRPSGAAECWSGDAAVWVSLDELGWDAESPVPGDTPRSLAVRFLGALRRAGGQRVLLFGGETPWEVELSFPGADEASIFDEALEVAAAASAGSPPPDTGAGG